MNMKSLNASSFCGQRLHRTSLRCQAAIIAPPDAGKAAQGYARPDKSGRYGASDRMAQNHRPRYHLSLLSPGSFGGRYVPETLIPALDELEAEYNKAMKDPAFKAELDSILKDYVGRETPLYFAERLSDHCAQPDGRKPKIYLKREDLNHTGAHKINNSLGQALLCKRMTKKRIIAGQPTDSDL